MEINVACPGIGSANGIVAAAPAVDQKDIDKPKLPEAEEQAKENSGSVIENTTESCVEEVDAKGHKALDDDNMESRIVVVVGDISCVLPINKVSGVDKVGVDATQTNLELKGSAENLELGSTAGEYLKLGHKNGGDMDDYEQIESHEVKEAHVIVYPRVIFPATFVSPEIEIQFGSLGKNTLIFPPAFVSPRLNIEFGSFGCYDTKIGMEDPNQETEPPCGANNNNPEMKVICETLDQDDKASDAQTEDAAPRFKDEKLSDTNTVGEDPGLVIETKWCAATNNNNPQTIDINLLEDEKVTCETLLEDDKAGDTQTEDAAPGFKDEKLSDTNTVVEDWPSLVIETKCAATSNNNPEMIVINLLEDEKVTCGTLKDDKAASDAQIEDAAPGFKDEKLSDANTMVEDSSWVIKAKCAATRNNPNVILKDLRQHDGLGVGALKAVPSFEIEKLNLQIKNARIQLGEKTRLRDAISHKVQKKMASLKARNEGVNVANTKAELVAKATSKSYKEDLVMEKLLRAQLIAAEAIHQQAYDHLNSLKNRLDDEMEEFMDELKTNEELGMFASKKQDTLDGPPSQKVASKSVPVPDEIKPVSTIETQKLISSVEEKHSDDQTKEKVAEENKQMMQTKEPANPTEMIDNQEMENINESRKADEPNKEAEQRAQKEATRKEKARLRRLRKKKNKRPCHDANNSSINDVGVADSNEIDNTNEEPHFVSKQVIQKIHVAPKFRNIKNWLQHSAKMPIVAGLILSLLSCYIYI